MVSARMGTARAICEEFLAVAAGQVGHGAQDPLAPQQGVGKDGMSLMWMPAQTTVPPLRTAASATGTSSPAGREDDGRVELDGGLLVRQRPAQVAPRVRAKSWLARSDPRVKA